MQTGYSKDFAGSVEVFGEFVGADYDTEVCDELAVLHAAKLLPGERELFATKWWDYRALHPTKATALFAHEYRLGFKRAARVYVDIASVDLAHGFKGESIFARPQREITGMWNARMMADRWCVPYRFWINTAIDYTADNGWKRFPRPMHLHSEEIVKVVCEAWLEELSGRLIEPKHPRYHAINYAGLPDQDAFQNWLCGQIAKRSQPQYSLAQYLYRTPMLTERAVAERFPPHIIALAREDARYKFNHT